MSENAFGWVTWGRNWLQISASVKKIIVPGQILALMLVVPLKKKKKNYFSSKISLRAHQSF